MSLRAIYSIAYSTHPWTTNGHSLSYMLSRDLRRGKYALSTNYTKFHGSLFQPECHSPFLAMTNEKCEMTNGKWFLFPVNKPQKILNKSNRLLPIRAVPCSFVHFQPGIRNAIA